MNHRQFRNILDLAFKDRAPAEYKRMKRQQQLAAYLDSLTGEAMQSIGTATEKAIAGLIGVNDSMKRVQMAEMARKTAEEVALSQALEAMPLETTEDENEPAEPMSLWEQSNDERNLSINRSR